MGFEMPYLTPSSVLRTIALAGAMCYAICCGVACSPANAQDPSQQASSPLGQGGPAAGVDPAELQRLAAEAANNRLSPPAPVAADLQGSTLNVLELLRQGGVIMGLIGIVSLLVVAVAFERLFALRRGKLYPRGLKREVRRASEELGSFQPQLLFDSALRYRCVGSRIVSDMLQKVGRPLPEVEAALQDATQREADWLYGNVRWLSLAAVVTPLIGLLGTVWGMIIAFHDTTQLGAGSNKAEYLAEGIYVALVTTLGGLAVAIPAAIFAHFFEGRITRVLALIDTDLRRLMPRFESQEGRARYDISSRGLVRREAPPSQVAPPPVGEGRRSHNAGDMAAAPPPPVRHK